MGRIRFLFAPLVLAASLPAWLPPAWSQGIVIKSIPAEPETDWSQPSFWDSVDGEPPESSWEFADGEIRLVRPRGGSGSLLSGPLPSNFELSWQWKIEPKTNTGLKYRVRKFGPKWLGVEYQIIDEPPASNSKGSTASIYDLVAPSADTKLIHPTGEWNSARVVAIGNRLEHYLNGKLVTSTRTTGPVWDASYATSKFWGAEGFGKPAALDRIMLTDHGGSAIYKDFRFVAHEPLSEAAEQLTAPFLGNAIRNSWADQTSIVLWTRTTARPEMNTDGLEFRSISKGDATALGRTNDAAKLLSVQLPDGATLDEMLGACPGAPGQVRLTYFPVMQRKAMKTTEWLTTSADSDFTAQWKLEDLKTDRQYAAVVEARPVGGDEPTAVVRGGFRTAPRADNKQELTFAMTTCHDFIRRDDGLKGHKIYPTLSKLEPDFVVHAGDIEYYDKPDPWALTIDLMRFKWARIFSLPSNRDFYQRTTSYFLKDDHDTLKNDCWVGQTYGAVTFEQGVKLFNEEQFPSHAPRYKTVRWGRDLQIWFLEGRDYRSPNNIPDGPDKTILGEEQKQWLFSTLAESDATFKLIFSPTPVVGPDRANKKDNHANAIFAHEGDELRGKLSQHEGVIVFCGDRHWQYASVDDETGLWEFGCGPGSEKHGLGWKKGDERPVHRFLRVAGGFLTGELTYTGDENKNKKPRLTLRHRKVSGEQVSQFVFPEADADDER
jgi:alkaline phosphatase D